MPNGQTETPEDRMNRREYTFRHPPRLGGRVMLSDDWEAYLREQNEGGFDDEDTPIEGFHQL